MQGSVGSAVVEGQGEGLMAAKRNVNTMLATNITRDLVCEYHDNGFVLVPSMFDVAEIGQLAARLPEICSNEGPRRVFERDGVTVRSVYGSHQSEPLFRQLAYDLRMVELARTIIGTDVYVHQFKINFKRALDGDVWSWHTDFVFWRKEDGIENPRLTTAAVFLDEVDEFNAPMIFIPGSQFDSSVRVLTDERVPEGYEGQPEWVSNLTADIKYSIPKTEVARLARTGGLCAPKGPRGSVLFFHPQVAHASSANLSTRDRVLALVTYNSICNLPKRTDDPRPDFLCARDYTAI